MIGGLGLRSASRSSNVSSPSSSSSSSTFPITTWMPSSSASISTVTSSMFWFWFATTPIFRRVRMTLDTDTPTCSQNPVIVIGTLMTFVPTGSTSSSISGSGSTFGCLMCFFLAFFSSDLGSRSRRSNLFFSLFLSLSLCFFGEEPFLESPPPECAWPDPP